MAKPTSQVYLLNTMMFGFWMALHCWAALYFGFDSVMPRHCCSSWQKNICMAEALHWSRAGKSAVFLVFCFLSSHLSPLPSSWLDWEISPTEDTGEKQLSYPSGVTAASHSWCILFSVSFTYVCFEAWSKAGKLVSKSSIKKRLHFKFLWPVSLVNKLNMSSHCDVLAESVDASQGGVNSRMSCRMGGVCIPPCPPFTAEAELFAEHYAPC